ncbi:DUF2069 domain-containing protein [Pelomonas sp. CA6]|uniref:DUF2069 domain-containing protein n=1 Tax=Pelomonas sp. CA6 TaxID=2907999 RepID=UPI001F4BE09D|nr:DUF2069 domain-containing protein [Pelomonas sp. CA6]MCH7344851.1 DUF2069 domain-containing protein [Pelomonas sp. CA6]
MSRSARPPLVPSTRSQPTAGETRSRNIACAAVLALALLCLAWELWLAPTGRGTLAIKALPLLLPLPGLWRYRMYTYRWVSLMLWLYVAEGAVRGGSDPHALSALLGWGEVVLAIAAFVACAAHVRQRLAAARASQPAEGTPGTVS